MRGESNSILVGPTVKASHDGLTARLSLSRKGRTRVDAQVGVRRDGWVFHPVHPSITVHTDSGPVHMAAPKARWALPQVTLKADGTVSVKLSLLNRAGVDVKASVRLVHDGGWSFHPETPELTLHAGTGPVDVSCRFRPPSGRRGAPGDDVTVQVLVNGMPVADARVRLRGDGAVFEPERRRISPLLLLVPLILLAAGLGAMIGKSDPPTATPALRATGAGSAPVESPPSTNRRPRPDGGRPSGEVPSPDEVAPEQPGPGGSGGDPSVHFQPARPREPAAPGAAPTRALTIVKSGAGSGTLTSLSPGIICGRVCTARFPRGTPVTVTATAERGSFVRSAGGAPCAGTPSTCSATVVLSRDQTLSASFGRIYTLTVTKRGSSGPGAVTSSPPGISCDEACEETTASFPEGTGVILTATVPPGNPSYVKAIDGRLCRVPNSMCQSPSLTLTGDRRVVVEIVDPTPR